MAKVLFVTHNKISYEILGMEYVSGALLRAGHETRACEADKAVAESLAWRPDFVAFQIITGDSKYFGNIAARIKDVLPNAKTIFGGPHFLFFTGAQQPEADIVIRGEAEEAIVAAVEGREWNNLISISELDSLAPPDRSLFYNERFPAIRDCVIRNEIACRGCPYKCTYCFVPGTMVHTSRGMVAIEDIVERGEIEIIYDAYGKERELSQFHVHDYEGKVFHVHIGKSCLPIVGTPNHEIFTEEGKKRLDELKVGDWVRIAIPKVGQELEPFMSPRLAGLYIAEGCISKGARGQTTSFSFHAKEEQYHRDVVDILHSEFGVKAYHVRQGNSHRVCTSQRHVSEILDEAFGHGAAEKRIHEDVFAWSREAKLAFLRAWMDGDGYKAQARIITVNQNLAMQGFLLALSCGMRPSLFSDRIRSNVLNGRTISSNNKIWSIAFEFNEDRLLLGCEAKKLKGAYLRNRDLYVKFKDGDAFLRVKRIETSDYTGKVYNLGVEEEHSYTANMVSVSNCYNSNKEWQAMVDRSRLRYHSPEYMVEDVMRVTRNYGGSLVSFTDDIFGVDVDWLERFTRAYKGVGLPFFAQLRPQLISEDRVKLLKEAGVHIISFAIESGNEKTRDEILDRHESNELIEAGCKLLHKYDIRFRMQNLLALPVDDPLGDALETLRFNMKCKPTLSWCSLLQAYPGTEIANYVVRKGLVPSLEALTPMVNDTFFEESSLPIPRRKQIERLHKYWSAVVRWQWLYPVVRILINVNLGARFHNWIFNTSKQYINKREYWRVKSWTATDDWRTEERKVLNLPAVQDVAPQCDV